MQNEVNAPKLRQRMWRQIISGYLTRSTEVERIIIG